VSVSGTSRAFVAVKADSSVITWGESGAGGDSSSVKAELAEGVVGLEAELDNGTQAIEEVASTPLLSEYLLAMASCRPCKLPSCYVAGFSAVQHEKSGIEVHVPPLVIGSLGGDTIILFHYCGYEAYKLISFDKLQKHLRASYAERAHFGDGVYASCRSPDQFGCKDAVLLNNYTNHSDPIKQEEQISYWRGAGAADYCIPIAVSRALCVDTSCEMTPEMTQIAHTVHNKHLRADRDVWVISIRDEDGKAQAAVEDPQLALQRLQHEDWSVRLDAIEMLMRNQAAKTDPRAAEAAIRCLKDSEASIRAAAIWLLASHSTYDMNEAANRIIEMQSDGSDEVRAAADTAIDLICSP